MVLIIQWHSESGHVFGWGNNPFGKLCHNNINTLDSNKPLKVILNDISIRKISCCQSHSLLLSYDGDIYWFGSNKIEKQMIPKKLTVNKNKFIDNASNRYKL